MCLLREENKNKYQAKQNKYQAKLYDPCNLCTYHTLWREGPPVIGFVAGSPNLHNCYSIIISITIIIIIAIKSLSKSSASSSKISTTSSFHHWSHQNHFNQNIRWICLKISCVSWTIYDHNHNYFRFPRHGFPNHKTTITIIIVIITLAVAIITIIMTITIIVTIMLMTLATLASPIPPA